jgi:hypothetical protein
VLRQQPDNIYAVNGLGTCLAELGHMAAAKQAFDEVRVCCCCSLHQLCLKQLQWTFCLAKLGHMATENQAFT